MEEHDLDSCISNVVDEPTSNAGHINFKNNQDKAKSIIYLDFCDYSFEYLKGCFYTLTNLYEKKDLSQKRGLENKLLNLKMEKIVNFSS